MHPFKIYCTPPPKKKKSVNAPKYFIDYISLKNDNFCFFCQFSHEIQQISYTFYVRLWKKRKKVSKIFQSNAVCISNHRCVPAVMLLIHFHIKKGIFTYTFPIKKEKLANLSSQFNEILQLKEGNFLKYHKDLFQSQGYFAKLVPKLFSFFDDFFFLKV